MAAVLFFPILVQIYKDVDAPVQPELLVVAEGGMDLEQATWPNLVETASGEIRIGQHTPDPRQGLQKLEHGAAIQEPQHIPNRLGQPLHHIEGQLLSLV